MSLIYHLDDEAFAARKTVNQLSATMIDRFLRWSPREVDMDAAQQLRERQDSVFSDHSGSYVFIGAGGPSDGCANDEERNGPTKMFQALSKFKLFGRDGVDRAQPTVTTRVDRILSDGSRDDPTPAGADLHVILQEDRKAWLNLADSLQTITRAMESAECNARAYEPPTLDMYPHIPGLSPAVTATGIPISPCTPEMKTSWLAFYSYLNKQLLAINAKWDEVEMRAVEAYEESVCHRQDIARRSIRRTVYSHKKTVSSDAHWNWQSKTHEVLRGVAMGEPEGPYTPVPLPPHALTPFEAPHGQSISSNVHHSRAQSMYDVSLSHLAREELAGSRNEIPSLDIAKQLHNQTETRSSSSFTRRRTHSQTSSAAYGQEILQDSDSSTCSTSSEPEYDTTIGYGYSANIPTITVKSPTSSDSRRTGSQDSDATVKPGHSPNASPPQHYRTSTYVSQPSPAPTTNLSLFSRDQVDGSETDLSSTYSRDPFPYQRCSPGDTPSSMAGELSRCLDNYFNSSFNPQTAPSSPDGYLPPDMHSDEPIPTVQLPLGSPQSVRMEEMQSKGTEEPREREAASRSPSPARTPEAQPAVGTRTPGKQQKGTQSLLFKPLPELPPRPVFTPKLPKSCLRPQKPFPENDHAPQASGSTGGRDKSRFVEDLREGVASTSRSSEQAKKPASPSTPSQASPVVDANLQRTSSKASRTASPRRSPPSIPQTITITTTHSKQITSRHPPATPATRLHEMTDDDNESDNEPQEPHETVKTPSHPATTLSRSSLHKAIIQHRYTASSPSCFVQASPQDDTPEIQQTASSHRRTLSSRSARATRTPRAEPSPLNEQAHSASPLVQDDSELHRPAITSTSQVSKAKKAHVSHTNPSSVSEYPVSFQGGSDTEAAPPTRSPHRKSTKRISAGSGEARADCSCQSHTPHSPRCSGHRREKRDHHRSSGFSDKRAGDKHRGHAEDNSKPAVGEPFRITLSAVIGDDGEVHIQGVQTKFATKSRR